MTEILCRYYTDEHKIETRVVRFHNIYGPNGTYDGGREKVPAALCRKVAKVESGGSIDIWGDGEQTRSFCHVDDCVEGIYRLMLSDHRDPLNLGTDRMVSINELARIIIAISGKDGISLNHIDGPQGVRGRNSDNTRLREVLGWEPKIDLEDGLAPDLPLDRGAGPGCGSDARRRGLTPADDLRQPSGYRADARRPGLVAAQVLGRPDERPQAFEIARQQPVRAGLDEDVAERRRLDRPGDHRQPAGVGGELAEQRVAGAAADEVDDVDRAPGQARRVARRSARYAGARLSRMHRTSAGRDRRRRAGRPRGRRPRSAPACRPAAGTTGSSGSMTRTAGRQLAGGGEQRRRGRSRRPVALPGPHRLLQQPQAHHVAQVADRAVDAALVGEVRRAAGLGQDRRVELDADQRPGPAGDVGEAGRPSAGTPTTADAVSCDPTSVTARRGARPVALATSSRSGPSASPGSRSGGQDRAGQPERLDEVGRPSRAVAASSSPVVDALVRSAPRTPVSQ